MRIFRTFLTVILVLGLFCTLASAEGNESLDKDFWGVNIKFDTKEFGNPRAIQFAIFDTDPGLVIKDKLTKAKDYIESSMKGKSLSEKTVLPKVFWNYLFSRIQGDKIYLLMNSEPENINMITISSDPAGDKWIVSKAFFFKGKNVCWAVPVKTKLGEEINVTLDEKNIYDLDKIFNDFIAIK